MIRRLHNTLLAALALFAVTLAAGLAPSVTPVLAAEPRILDATQYPWSAIGRVNSAGRNFCTGFLVSPRTLLTAGHCLYDPQQARWYAPDEVHFIAGYQRDKWLAHSVARSYTVAGDYDPERPPNLETAIQDWAVIVLEQPLGERVGWLGVELFGPELLREMQKGGLTISQVGYRRDRAHVQTLRDNCGVPEIYAGGRGILHSCDVIEMASGSPLLVFRDGLPSVLGLHTIRAETESGEAIAGAVSTWLFHPEKGSAEARAASDAAGVSWGQGSRPR